MDRADGRRLVLCPATTVALNRYEDSLRKNPGSTQAYLRLSDAWFRLGDIDKERHSREAIYGVLK